MKKFLAMLLSLAMLVCMLTACGSSSSSSGSSDSNSGSSSTAGDATGTDETYLVGIVTYYVNSSFESSFNTAAINECEALGLEYKSYDANQDMAAYQSCFENAVADGVDAIVCVPSDPTAMGPQCELCEENGVVLVVMAAEPDGYYSSVMVVEDAAKGAQKAQLIADAIGEGGKVVMLLGNQQQTGWVTENDAAKEVFAEYNIEIVAEEDPQAQQDTAMTYMETWLAQGIEFDAVWCATDTVAAGACAAMEQANYDFDSVYMVSEDGDETGLLLVQNGQLDATLVLSGVLYGTGTLDLAFVWLFVFSPLAFSEVEIEVATPENVDEYIALLP